MLIKHCALVKTSWRACRCNSVWISNRHLILNHHQVISNQSERCSVHLTLYVPGRQPFRYLSMAGFYMYPVHLTLYVPGRQPFRYLSMAGFYMCPVHWTLYVPGRQPVRYLSLAGFYMCPVHLTLYVPGRQPFRYLSLARFYICPVHLTLYVPGRQPFRYLSLARFYICHLNEDYGKSNKIKEKLCDVKYITNSTGITDEQTERVLYWYCDCLNVHWKIATICSMIATNIHVQENKCTHSNSLKRCLILFKRQIVVTVNVNQIKLILINFDI